MIAEKSITAQRIIDSISSKANKVGFILEDDELLYNKSCIRIAYVFALILTYSKLIVIILLCGVIIK